MRPWCRPTSSWTRARPMPVPPGPLPGVSSTRLKSSKIDSRRSWGMPTPVSSTSMTASAPSERRRTRTRPPGGVNLMALPTRLRTMVSTFSGSARRLISSAAVKARSRRRWVARGMNCSTRFPAKLESSMAWGRSTVRPAWSRVMSRRWSMRRISRAPLRLISSRRATTGLGSLVSSSPRSSSRGARSRVRGVRSSWSMWAKNRLLSWSSSWSRSREAESRAEASSSSRVRASRARRP